MAEPWTPSLEQVADHISTRSRDTTTPGSDALLGTFNATTTPTGEQAGRVIASAVGVVLGAVGGTVPATLSLSLGAPGEWRNRLIDRLEA